MHPFSTHKKTLKTLKPLGTNGLSNSEAELKKCVGYKKKHVIFTFVG